MFLFSFYLIKRRFYKSPNLGKIISRSIISNFLEKGGSCVEGEVILGVGMEKLLLKGFN